MALALVRRQIEKSSPPRAMYVDFPLGRPLGKPADPGFQRDVMMAAFALFDEPSGPVLVDHPVTIEDEADEGFSCTLPPRFDPDLPPAVDEAIGLRPAYDRTVERTGHTSVGRAGDADAIPDLVRALIRIAEGVPVGEAEVPGGDHLAVALDIRSYYEEAALSLTDHVPGARQTESWIFQDTEIGEVFHAAQSALRDQEVPRPQWYFLMPLTQSRLDP